MYSVARDDYGYAIAIEKDGSYILHLDRGTKLNEENIDQIVAVLNGTYPSIPNEVDDLNTRLNRMALEMADLDLDNPHDLEARRRLNNEYIETFDKLARLQREK